MSDTRKIHAWMDLETTGLDAKSGRILEYAIVFTDEDLDEVGSLTAVIPQNVGIARTMMDDYVTKMHTSNGLLEELESLEVNAPQYGDSIEAADEQLTALLKKIARESNKRHIKFTMAGSNVLFDIKWMMEHMPSLLANMDHRSVIEGPESYRSLDVSAYKAGFGQLFAASDSATHRAMDDIRFSIGQQRRMQMIVDAGVKSLSEQGVILGV